MDSQQAKILLEKINALQRSINLNKGSIASIERDLMLSYIRQLYEVYLSANSSEIATKPKPEVVEQQEIKVAPKPQELEVPRQTYTPPKETYTPPKVVEPPKPPIIKEEPVVQKQPVAPAYQTQPTYTPPPAPTNPTPTPPPTQRIVYGGNSNYEVLFNFPKSNELSERLSDRPVQDLSKAFAINDRLLYINELFSRDASAFNDTLQLLNKFERMDEAKSLLVSLAEQYDWTREERLEIAQGFVKTVRRKYV
ncbi:MAG: hypothetical protein ACK4TA_19885 [Saprospiraceae bacterium]